ncbi:MAG: DUF3035 domain-containing protein [Alphaproteobacteria bacterium]
MRYPIISFALCLILAGCSSVREHMGLNREGPNEYESLRNEGLEMPTTIVLQDPKLGIRRPQQQSISQKAMNIIVSDSTVSHPKTMPASKKIDRKPDLEVKSEQMLLEKIGVNKKQEGIRQTIDQEAHHEPTLEQKIKDQIFFWKKKKRGKVIDPEEEKETLEKENSPILNSAASTEDDE